MTQGVLVLVVDDYADTRDMLSFALEAAGYGVLVAETGREALVMAHRHHPAVVVMDIFMPDMDGIEATRRLRADPHLGRIPIVAHTARPWGLAGIEDLFDAVCPKPCPPDLLVELVGQALHAEGDDA